MKRIMMIVVACLMTLIVVGCAGNTQNNNGSSETGDRAQTGIEYADTWKANVATSVTAEGKTYETYIIVLNGDGTGSYRDRQGTWEYNQEENKIVLTLNDENIGLVLEIDNLDGVAVLKYYQDTYYRDSDFDKMTGDKNKQSDG